MGKQLNIGDVLSCHSFKPLGEQPECKPWHIANGFNVVCGYFFAIFDVGFEILDSNGW